MCINYISNNSFQTGLYKPINTNCTYIWTVLGLNKQKHQMKKRTKRMIKFCLLAMDIIIIICI